MNTKICKDCRQELPFTAFYLSKGQPRQCCINCWKLRTKQYYRQDIDASRLLARLKGQNRYRTDLETSRKKTATVARARGRRLRCEALQKLGNRCSCGVTDSRVLQFDHIHNGGSKQRRESKISSTAMSVLVLNSPDGVFQLLCANCNWRKRLGLLKPPSTRNAEHSAAYAKRKRDAAVALLGGHCACCAETDAAVLQFDHLQSGGRKDRELIGRSHGVALDVLKHGNIKYQLLCANCNQIKRAEQREFPHKYLEEVSA